MNKAIHFVIKLMARLYEAVRQNYTITWNEILTGKSQPSRASWFVFPCHVPVMKSCHVCDCDTCVTYTGQHPNIVLLHKHQTQATNNSKSHVSLHKSHFKPERKTYHFPSIFCHLFRKIYFFKEQEQ